MAHHDEGQNRRRMKRLRSLSSCPEGAGKWHILEVCDAFASQKKRTGSLPSSLLFGWVFYLMLPAKFTVMEVSGMAEVSLETVTSPSYMAFTRAL